MTDVEVLQALCHRYAAIGRLRHHRIQRVMSFDRGFDAVPGIERVH